MGDINTQKALPVDRQAGIKQSFGSEELYEQILEAFLEESDDYLTKLPEFLADKNWKEYMVIAHAIKSNSRQIGAEALFEEAFEMEKAARAEDENAVVLGHDRFIADYTRVINYIRSGFSDIGEDPVREEEPDIEKTLPQSDYAYEQEDDEARFVKNEMKEYLTCDGGDESDIIVKDMVNLLTRNNRKIVRMDLTTRSHLPVLLHEEDHALDSGYSPYIDEWLKYFADNGMVHPEELEDYRTFTNIGFLREYFDKNDETLVMRYRRRVEQEFHWAEMVMIKSLDYSAEHRNAMLFIRDIDKVVNRDAVTNHALIESFNIFLSCGDDPSAVVLFLDKLNDFYGAEGVCVYRYKKNGARVMLYEASEKPAVYNFDERWTIDLGKGLGVFISVSGPKINNKTRLFFRFISRLVGGILRDSADQENRKRILAQERIVLGLSEVYFCVYLVDLDKNTAEPVSSPDFVRAVFGNSNNIGYIFERLEENLVEETHREKMHEFNDTKMWKKQLLAKNSISMEFLGPHVGWSRANVIVSRRGPGNSVREVIYAVQEINDQRAREEKANKAIEQALNEARQASQAKSDFLSNMSHDIRTPMNAVIGFTKLAREHIEDRALVKEYLEGISKAGEHLMSLINSILDMSRIESGRVSIEPEPSNIVEIAWEIRNILEADTSANDIDFNVNVDEITNDNVMCDRLRLKQILINLLGNAVKFTEKGGTISLDIREKKSESGKDINIYEFNVKDNGCGISEEFLSRIYDAFERERNSTVSGIQGTGLGMAITKRLVDMMGGTINIHSEKNNGTEVIVSIPLAKADTPVDSPKAGSEKAPVDLSGIRILLVEDNLVNRQIARAILGDKGITMEEALNGQEAIDMLREKGPGYYNLILMDIQMPVMNGYEAARSIRAMEDRDIANIPIIAMTANAFEEDKKQALDAGMDGHIAKPIDIEELVSVIQKAVSK